MGATAAHAAPRKTFERRLGGGGVWLELCRALFQATRCSGLFVVSGGQSTFDPSFLHGEKRFIRSLAS